VHDDEQEDAERTDVSQMIKGHELYQEKEDG
jgi:hypothetical protein